MIDSGGFALLMNPRASWTVRSVGDLMAKIDAQIFVSLDLPPHSTDTVEARKIKTVSSNRNFRILTDRFPEKTIMPVVHGRTIQEVEFSITSLSKIVQKPRWIGLGGIVPLLQHRHVSKEISRLGAEVFIAKALDMIRRSFPKAKIHAFGAGGMRTFPAVFAFGADSADSIGWRQAAGFGSIFLPLKSQRAIRWDVDRPPPRRMLDEDDLEQLRACRCPVCRSMDGADKQMHGLWESFQKRAIHNAWTTVNQYRFWPDDRPSMAKFVASGNLGSQWARAMELYR